MTDGADDVGWNDAGATGTLTLIEPLSSPKVAGAATAPVIDGDIDAAWAGANAVTTDKQVAGRGRRERRRADALAGQHAVRARRGHRPDPRRLGLRPVDPGLRRDLRRRGQRQERLVPVRRHADPHQLQQRRRRSGPATKPFQDNRLHERDDRSSTTATSSRPRSACSRTAASAPSMDSTSR